MTKLFFIPSTSPKLKGGYTGFTLTVCPSASLSVCEQNSVRSVSSTILTGSISYLQILSSNFRRCVACKIFPTSKNLKFWQILWICYFDFVLFWIGIQYESIVWVTRMWNMISSPAKPTMCLEQKSENFNFQSRNVTLSMPSQSQK